MLGYLALDFFLVAVDIVSIIVLIFIVVVAGKSVSAYRHGRETLTESASLLGAIVNALSSRIELSGSVVHDLRSEVDLLNRRADKVDDQQSTLRSAYLQLLRRLEEILSTDRELISEVERLKTSVATIGRRPPPSPVEPIRQREGPVVDDGNILAALTDTERQTLDVLAREGPKAAPELGRRLKKSREHTSRLMKKLYMEGYIDRESTHPPFRYKLNDKVRASLQSTNAEAVTAKASEKA